MKGSGGKGGEGEVKTMVMSFAYVPTPHDEFNYCVLQICINKK